MHLVELIQVSCQRGEGAAKRSVTQIWTKGGDLVAEHDEIHSDPIYASHFLRKALAEVAQAPTQSSQPATESVAEQGV